MKGHSWFITQLVFPLTMNALCWPVVFGLWLTGRLTPLERSCQWWKFAAIAVMAGVGNLVNAWPQVG